MINNFIKSYDQSIFHCECLEVWGHWINPSDKCSLLSPILGNDREYISKRGVKMLVEQLEPKTLL